jgi:hypothetical protein
VEFTTLEELTANNHKTVSSFYNSRFHSFPLPPSLACRARVNHVGMQIAYLNERPEESGFAGLGLARRKRID